MQRDCSHGNYLTFPKKLHTESIVAEIVENAREMCRNYGKILQEVSLFGKMKGEGADS